MFYLFNVLITICTLCTVAEYLWANRCIAQIYQEPQRDILGISSIKSGVATHKVISTISVVEPPAASARMINRQIKSIGREMKTSRQQCQRHLRLPLSHICWCLFWKTAVKGREIWLRVERLAACLSPLCWTLWLCKAICLVTVAISGFFSQANRSVSVTHGASLHMLISSVGK